MKKILLFVFFVLSFVAHGQSWKWAHANRGYGHGAAMAFDKSGNIFLSGWQDDSTFIEKFSNLGDSLWMKYRGFDFGTTLNMSLGPDTSIYLVGYGGYNVSFSYISKYDKLGNLVWNYRNSAGGEYSDNRGNSIAIDSYGNSYASGIYDSVATFGSCTFINPHRGTFVVKLSPAGNCLWSMDIPNGGYYFSYVTIDHNDDLIISTPDSVIKISNNQVEWVIPIKCKGLWHPIVSEINTDSDNNLYFVVGGDSVQVGQIDHYTSPYHGLLVKLTPSGTIT